MGETDTKAQTQLSGFIDDIVSTNDALIPILEGLKTKFTDVDTATADLATTSEDAAEGLDRVGKASYSAATALNYLANAAYAAASEMGGGAAATIRAIKSDSRILMPQVGR